MFETAEGAVHTEAICHRYSVHRQRVHNYCFKLSAALGSVANR